MSAKRNMEIIGLIMNARRRHRSKYIHWECVQQPLIYETEKYIGTHYCDNCPYFLQGMKLGTTLGDIKCLSKPILVNRYGVS